MASSISTPARDEFAPFYADYIERASKKDVLKHLPQQIEDIRSALGDLSDIQACYRPGPEEWSIKQVLSHLIDGERVFSYRLLRFSRNDATPLPGFEQEDYVREAGADNVALGDLIDEFEYLRRANILMIRNLSSEAVDRRGQASGAQVSVRALIYIMVGHVEHHMASLHEKYLSAAKKA